MSVPTSRDLCRSIVPLTLIILDRIVRLPEPGHCKDRPACSGPSCSSGSWCWLSWDFARSSRRRRSCWAFNPYYAMAFFIAKPATAFVSLGAVVLAVTGCEALYADMGHFGKRPIRYAWLFIASSRAGPCLFRPGRDNPARSAHDRIRILCGRAGWAHYPTADRSRSWRPSSHRRR